MCPFTPAFSASCLSSSKALAVIATIEISAFVVTTGCVTDSNVFEKMHHIILNSVSLNLISV